MQAALPYIVILQLILTLMLAVLLFGLARQVGILHERVAPMGAMSSDQGPEVGEMAPVLAVTTLAGEHIALGGASRSGRSRLLLFVSPACPVCKKLLPIARSFSDAERLEVLLVGDGDEAEQRAMIRDFELERMAYLNAPQVGMTFHVGKLPYAILLDAEGIIRAKGLVNNREHLESLIIAEETGFGTIQAYLDAKNRLATKSHPA
ncbi:MAG TPA: methylamine dehydrogenase accessory protein MauD [Steroidobacteraceae bacterium]|nr:methylamine dehydrogenase accessory protein MauD [Steroidobacteraceae bacterium]